MEFTKRKKIYILVGMFALLAVTGFLNFSMNNQTTTVGGGVTTNQDFFVMFTQTRTAERAANKAILQNIASNESNFTQEARTRAANDLMNLMNVITFEDTTEMLITRHGFQNVIVTKTNDNVNILVRSATELEGQEREVAVANIFGVIQSNFPGGSAALDIERVFLSFIR